MHEHVHEFLFGSAIIVIFLIAVTLYFMTVSMRQQSLSCFEEAYRVDRSVMQSSLPVEEDVLIGGDILAMCGKESDIEIWVDGILLEPMANGNGTPDIDMNRRYHAVVVRNRDGKIIRLDYQGI